MDLQRFLIRFYAKNKNHAFIRILRDIYSHEAKIYDLGAEYRLQRLRNARHDVSHKIRVAFLITDPNVWNKQQGIYEAMTADSRFETFLICMTDPTSDTPNAAYSFLSAMNLSPMQSLQSGKLLDLRELRPDYVFYGQPYNNYLPRAYRSFVVSKYAKVCIMSYGMTVSWNFMEIHPRSFHRDVYLRYAVVREDIEYNRQRFPRLAAKGLQETKYLGFPAFDSFLQKKHDPCPSFAFSRNNFRVIWTPRWVTDESLGGSNFFRYKDVLFDYAEKHPDVDFLFRPHPMALDNFVSTGEMTQTDADAFRKKCSDAPNLSLDIEKEYAPSFWNSSVLVSDLSSIIPEFFITGKPIIYCNTKQSQQNFLPYFQKILDANYVVNDKKQLCEAIDTLKAGCDPKAELRHTLIAELFGNTLNHSAELIKEDIIADFYKTDV